MAYNSVDAANQLNQITGTVENTISSQVKKVETTTDDIRKTNQKIKEMILKVLMLLE